MQEKLRERIEKDQDLKAQGANVEAPRAAIERSERRLTQITPNYRTELHRERVETEDQRLKNGLEKQSHRAGLLEL